jgi:hypothetical protein
VLAKFGIQVLQTIQIAGRKAKQTEIAKKHADIPCLQGDGGASVVAARSRKRSLQNYQRMTMYQGGRAVGGGWQFAPAADYTQRLRKPANDRPD